jgi:N-acetylglucosaminyldiphosphoundecaprenol N-acetyl-beta-D-mannosaminyltransferase
LNRVGSADLLGLPFALVTQASAVATCLEWCRGPRESRVLMTANASHLCMMQHDAVLRAACDGADLVVADGMSVVWALRAAGINVPERVAGVDLMVKLLARGGAEGLRVYFLGAKPQVVTKLSRDCGTRYPGLVVAGYRDGYFTAADHAAIAEEIRAAKPHMLFVGMPSPFKETWVEEYRGRLNVPVIIGVGGSFDVLAGFVERAPATMQRLGLEWAWRLMMEPRKLWKRYLTTNTEFIWRAGREVLLRRFGQPVISGSRGRA